MRASRLLHMLLLLQNRGRMTSVELARELEVAPRTILRDVDAMTEAGLPIVVLQGNQGGIELGFNYRTRLTGLDEDEARALGVLLAARPAALERLGLAPVMEQVRRKLVESFPDKVRQTVQRAMTAFPSESVAPPDDPRLPALRDAVWSHRIVRIQANTDAAQRIHPVSLRLGQSGWQVEDAISGAFVPLEACGDINISAHRFTPVARP